MGLVIEVTVMRGQWFMLDVSMLKECEGDGKVGVGHGGSVVVVSATRGLGTVSSEADVLWMSMVRGIRGVRGVCEMCGFGSGRGRVEWIRVLGLGFTNPMGTGECVWIVVVWVL